MPIINEENSANSNRTTEVNYKPTGKIGKRLDLLDKKMDSLYKDIYITRTDNKNSLNSILTNIDNSLDKLQATNVSISGMSELLRRIQNKTGNPTVDKLFASVEDLFNDQSLLSSLFISDEVRRFIQSQNYQYDMICKYLPKLLEALEVKRDCVLCSDNFNKKYLNPKSVKTSKEEVEIFTANTKRLENEYDISTFFDKTYMNTSIYGEDFIYIVPYDVAFKRLIKRINYRGSSARLGQMSFYESASGNTPITGGTQVCLKESWGQSSEYKKYIGEVKETYILDGLDKTFKGSNVTLHFNDTGISIDTINEYAVIRDLATLEKFRSLSEEAQLIHEANRTNNSTDSIFSNVAKRNKAAFNASTPVDGLILSGNLDRDPDKIDNNFTGCVLERLPRENVIPVYIGKKCLGYYFFDFKEDHNVCGYCGQHHMTPGISNAQNYSYEMSQDQQELAVRFIAAKISQSIDSHFINVNKDLKEEIYAILRYNDQFDVGRANDVSISFLPAEDVIHSYFDIDDWTHRGISDLQKSLVPAMLYILLYLTDIIGKITRSTDKRVYYVKQNVEQNVARTMMNVVQQIKKQNMGMRQIESMNNILNIVGKYNDYIIPVGPSGDAPIQFEVMQGQEINTPTDIMDKMEEAAVNSTGVPLELVNSALQQDFATRFTMSSTRFIKAVFTRQRIVEKIFSRMYTKIYNYEFCENYAYIEIELPPPTFLISSNREQILSNMDKEAEAINNIELADEDDDIKKEWKKIHFRNQLGTYLDYDMIEKEIDQARMNVEAKKKAETTDGEDSKDYDY